jgi:hypothetical protein
MMMSEPNPNPVPGVGHFNRTLLGHFWRAAKKRRPRSTPDPFGAPEKWTIKALCLRRNSRTWASSGF